MNDVRVCAFCGKKLTDRLGLGEQHVDCGGGYEVACNSCERKFRELEPVERCKLALESGMASNMEQLKGYLAKHADDLDAVYSGLNCLRCGGRMKYGGEMGNPYFGTMRMNVQYCEACGKMEFYWADQAPGKME